MLILDPVLLQLWPDVHRRGIQRLAVRGHAHTDVLVLQYVQRVSVSVLVSRSERCGLSPDRVGYSDRSWMKAFVSNWGLIDRLEDGLTASRTGTSLVLVRHRQYGLRRRVPV